MTLPPPMCSGSLAYRRKRKSRQTEMERIKSILGKQNTSSNWKKPHRHQQTVHSVSSRQRRQQGNQGFTEFDKRMVRFLIGIPTGKYSIDNFAVKSSLPHQDFCRSCHDNTFYKSTLQNFRHRFLGDRTFEELGMVKNMTLGKLTGFIHTQVLFKTTTTGS